MKSFLQTNYNNFIVIITFLIISINATSQTIKKETYHSGLDSLWSKGTYINNMTTDGKWVVLTELYDTKENMLLLKHTTNNITYKFPNSQWIRVSDNDRWFGCINSHHELQIIDLVETSKDSYQNIQSYSFSKTGEYMAALKISTQTTGTLLLVNLNTKITSIIKGVKEYVWHPNRNILLVTIQEEEQNLVGLYDVKNLSLHLLKENLKGDFNNLLWSENGNAVIFSEQLNSENTLNYYPLDRELVILNDTILTKEYPKFEMSSRLAYISNDGKKVLFYRQVIEEEKEGIEDKMEVWNTEDPWIYPKMKEYKENKLRNLLTAWYPETNTLVSIETNEKPTTALNVNHEYALVYDELKYEPLYKEFPNTDIYVKSMKSGEEYLVVKNQYLGSKFVTISLHGDYVVYFKNKDWWVYDILKKNTTNLTKGLKTHFENNEIDLAGDVIPYGHPGWSTKEDLIILYDRYDIWLMTPDGTYKERITKGREENIKYRISEDYIKRNNYKLSVNVNFLSTSFDLQKGVILEMYDDKLFRTGYAQLRNQNMLRKILLENKKIDGIQISEDFKYVVLRKQKFNEPIGIYRIDIESKKQHLLYQSNKDLLNYDLGHAEHLEYKIGDETLLGTLLYPANFDHTKKYPLIVSIYEKQANKWKTFDSPSNYNYTGFNTLKYTTNDYFILYPDISYTIGKPGISALNCVTKAVNKVLELGFIDKHRIGLIGHSFGGYESAFIATQTDMFAAIVAGSSVTDFRSHYHSVGWNWKQPEMWRYESQQWRMGDSFYNIKNAYKENSPMHYVENVRTPLLFWTGKEDYQVYWKQSIEMFLALKRLGNNSKLLLIENESHIITNKDNQKKLSVEIFNWFERYCK